MKIVLINIAPLLIIGSLAMLDAVLNHGAKGAIALLVLCFADAAILLSGRNKMRITLRIGDTEVEAGSVNEIKGLLDQIQNLKDQMTTRKE